MDLGSDHTSAENAGSLVLSDASLSQRAAHIGVYEVLDGEILSPNDTVCVSIAPHPLKIETRQVFVRAGLSLAEIVSEIQQVPFLRRYGHAWINGTYAPYEHWHLIRPKAGTRVDIRLLPKGGGGQKNIFRTLLQIAVIVASIAIPAMLPAALTAATVVGPLTVGQLISAGILIVGTLLVNAIAPLPKPKLRSSGTIESDSPTLFITGSRNQFNPFAVVPRILGKHRVVPPYAALPVTETAGGDQYVRLLFCYGYGPVTRESQRIGETLLSEYEGVETEFRRGYPSALLTDMGNWDASTGAYPSNPSFGYKYTVSVAGTVDGVSYVVGDTIIFNDLAAYTSSAAWDKNHDKPFTLFPSDVFEEPHNILLSQAAGWVLRTSQPNADEISVDIAFMSGLVEFDSEANKTNRTVTFEIESSPTGANTWTHRATKSITARQTNALVETVRWVTESRAQYDVRIRRITPDADTTSIIDTASWIVLRTFTNTAPINMDGIAGEALRIKATDQLRGIVDQYNCVLQSILLDWDSGTQTWKYRPTSNNASCFREVLQGAANAAALSDSRLHLESIQDWHEYCTLHGFEYNWNRDTASSVNDVLNEICAAGRASKLIIDNKWGVVYEEAQTVPVQHFTPRNSWGFEGTRVYPELPHGFRCRFTNRDLDWALDERIVYDDGYNADGSDGLTAATTFLELDMSGITNTEHVWKMARFHYAQIKLRPDRYRIWTDMEYLVARRGQMVLLSHDVISTGLAWGRIVSLTTDSNSDVIQITCDESFEMELGQTYGISVRTPDNIKLTCALVTVPGTSNTLTLATPIAAADAPNEGALVTFGYLGSESLEVIVASITPGDNNTAQLELYDAAPAVHAADTEDIPEYTSNISAGVAISYPAVVAIRSDEEVLIVNPDGSWIAQIQLSLGYTGRRPTEVTGIQARFRPSGSQGPWSIVNTASNAAEVLLAGVTPDETYEFQVRYLTEGTGQVWGPLLTHTVDGPKQRPPVPTNLRLENGKLHWSYVKPRDHWGFYLKIHRLLNTYWDTAELIHPTVWTDSPFDVSNLLNGTVTFLIKSVDLAGNVSEETATLTVTASGIDVDHIVESVDYAGTGFPGVITNGSVNGTDLEADDDGTLFWSGNSANQFWSTTSTDLFWDVAYLKMVYEFSYTPGFTPVATDFITIAADVTAESWTLEYRTGSLEAFWTGTSSNLFWTGTPTNLFWSPLGDWAMMPAKITNIKSLGYNFRLTTVASTIRGVITDLSLLAGAAPVMEFVDDAAIGASGSRLALSKTFRTITSVIPALVDDAGTAVRVKVIDKNAALGPLIETYDSTGTGTAGTVDAFVEGY